VNMRSMARKRKFHGSVQGQKGVALIEVLVAIAILGVVVVAFLSALTAAYGGVIVAERHTRAESLTRTAFEYMRTLEYDDASNFNGSSALPVAWRVVGDSVYGYPYLADNNKDYKVQVTSYPSTDNSGSPVKVITVVILNGDTAVDTTTTYRSDPNRNF
jgi:prepilin-type N-terminal cleavage/methylation domain-containing protein